MEARKFRYYEHKPCKFVLRSGKQIFGIVWSEKQNDDIKYFFSSAMEYMKTKISAGGGKESAYPITLDELIHAEFLR